jgi:hypothetical protein
MGKLTDEAKAEIRQWYNRVHDNNSAVNTDEFVRFSHKYQRYFVWDPINGSNEEASEFLKELANERREQSND